MVFRCGGAADFPQQLYSSLPDGVPIRVHWAVMSRAIHGSLPDKLAETLCALKIQRIWGHFRRFLNSSFSLWPGFRDLCFITPLLDTITLRLLEQSRRLHLESHRFPFWEFRSRVYRDWGQFQGRLGRFCPRNLLLEGILLWEFGFSFDHLLGAQFILLNQPYEGRVLEYILLHDVSRQAPVSDSLDEPLHSIWLIPPLHVIHKRCLILTRLADSLFLDSKSLKDNIVL